MHTLFAPRAGLSGPFSVPGGYSDSRGHGHQGPTRNVRFPRVASNGGGAIAKSEDGERCVVAGKESLRILHFLQPSQSSNAQPHKTAVGRGKYRIEASRNFWDGSGLKIDSASTDVAWGRANFSNKILTSARNGEFIMWDINRATPHKYERRSKLHIRSINEISISPVIPHYCITGSTDGDLRVWDLRDTTKSLMRIYHPISVRSAVFSPTSGQPLQAMVGLDNGSIYRWDLKMGPRGQLDRLLVAHSGPILSLDWCNAPARSTSSGSTSVGSGLGWFASGGLDRSVKVWNLTAPGSHAHISHKPTYSLHPSFPVRRVVWRPGYECELGVVSNEAFGTSSNHDPNHGTAGPALSHPRRAASAPEGGHGIDSTGTESVLTRNSGGDPVEIWDVRRRWIAKWSVTGSAVDGGVTDLVFADSHTLWTQHSSGMFSQIDLRDCVKPIDAVPRVAITWEGSGSMAYVSDKISPWETPYDDIHLTPGQQLLNEQKFRIKSLGDDAAVPPSQTMGAHPGVNDLDSFSQLAGSLSFEGTDRRATCRLNADAAFQAGNDEAARAWLLLASLLTDISPESAPLQAEAPIQGRKDDEPIPRGNGSSSPRLTDSGSSSSARSTSQRRPNSLERETSRKNTRSRSLAAAATTTKTLGRPLAKQESRSSIRTITACESSSHRIEDRDQARLHAESSTSDSPLSPETRQEDNPAVSAGHSNSLQVQHTTDSEEKKSRQLGWDVLRGRLEDFADKGDTQMCAFLSLLAPQELHISQKRVNRFLESYIDMLTRLRLFTSAAHMRKYSGSEELGAMTRLETTIPTLCAGCRKPCTYSHAEPSRPTHHQPKGRYSYCRACRSYPATCSICRLPVRTMLFHCPVCRHGGHRECYVRYYMARPMTDIPASILPTATRSRPTSTAASYGERVGSDDGSTSASASVVTVSDGTGEQAGDHNRHRLSGHPCAAAGCGHICWAANIPLDYKVE